MTVKTKIDWCDFSLNPGVYGCEKVSEACRGCYAMSMAHRLVAMEIYPPGITRKTSHGVEWTGKVEVDAGAIGPAFAKLPKTDRVTPCAGCEGPRFEGFICGSCGATADGQGVMRRRQRVFVTSMGDLFHEDVPDWFIELVFKAMIAHDQHTYLVLTKRPERVAHWFRTSLWGVNRMEWPEHVWIGTTVEDQAQAELRIPHLLRVPATTYFVSCEPLLGPITLDMLACDLDGFPGALNALTGEWWPAIGDADKEYDGRLPFAEGSKIDWLIAGGESGPRARPTYPGWFRGLRDQARGADVAFFFKQHGEWVARVDCPDGVPCPDDVSKWGVIKPSGEFVPGTTCWNGRNAGEDPSGEWAIRRVGRRAAGRALDAIEWNQIPNPTGAPHGR